MTMSFFVPFKRGLRSKFCPVRIIGRLKPEFSISVLNGKFLNASGTEGS